MGKLKNRLLSIDEELAMIEQYDTDTWPQSMKTRYQELQDKLQALNPSADYDYLSVAGAINCIFH